MAIPDHPWTKVTRDNAAVRIAMTVAQPGKHDGLLLETVAEQGVETDSPVILFNERKGVVNSDLTVGVDVVSAAPMKANEGLSSRGMSLHGAGFIISPSEAKYLGLGRRSGLERHIRLYRNGRDWNNRDTYKNNWWIFGEPRSDLRPALAGLARYIATVETAKHRIFQFLDASILPDNMLVAIALSDGYSLGVLSSRFHVNWALRAGGWLGIGNDPRYSKSRCFDPFPFPTAAADDQKAKIAAVAEELDAHRKRVLADHGHLTLTGLYNVVERLKSGDKPDNLNDKERSIFDDGLVLIVKELHEKLDIAVAEAYGWPVDLAEEEVLARLIALNKERSKEEKRGLVRWLRPEYQIPRFGSDEERAEQLEADLGETILETVPGQKPSFPKDECDQTFAVHQALMEAEGAIEPAAIAASFKQGRKCLTSVSAVVASLYRMGLVSTSDGKSFALRRAA